MNKHIGKTVFNPEQIKAGVNPGRDHTLLMKFEQPDRL